MIAFAIFGLASLVTSNECTPPPPLNSPIVKPSLPPPRPPPPSPPLPFLPPESLILTKPPPVPSRRVLMSSPEPYIDGEQMRDNNNENRFVKEDIVNSDCDFQVLRFRKNEVKCYDMGKHEKYCDHYSIPHEFKVTKEIGIGNQDVFTFTPHAMYTETSNSKTKIASFYYRFTCNKQTNNPKLQLIIYPTTDVSPVVALIMFLVIVFILGLLFSMCPNDSKNDGFLLGYALGGGFSSSNKRTYCE